MCLLKHFFLNFLFCCSHESHIKISLNCKLFFLNFFSCCSFVPDLVFSDLKIINNIHINMNFYICRPPIILKRKYINYWCENYLHQYLHKLWLSLSYCIISIIFNNFARNKEYFFIVISRF